MQTLRWRLILGATALAMLASCASNERPVPRRGTQAPRPTRPPATTAAPIADSAYVAQASSIDLFEILSSELALQRSSSKSIREFAQMMIAAHRGTSAQLSFAGRRLNLLPSARLQPRHQAMLDALRASPSFDAAYKRDQLAVHQEALALHRAYAARGRSPTLRPVAAAAVPIVERHLRLVRYL